MLKPAPSRGEVPTTATLSFLPNKVRLVLSCDASVWKHFVLGLYVFLISCGIFRTSMQ